TEKLVQDTVNLVGAGPGDDVDVTAGLAAELCTVVRGFDLDFLNGINRRREDVGLVRCFFSRNAIEEVLIVRGIVPMDAEGADPRSAFRLMPRVSSAIGNAGGDQTELHEVPGGQRKVNDGSGLDQVADLRVARL